MDGARVMTECVILFRNPTNDRVGFVANGEDDDGIAVFEGPHEADEVAQTVPVIKAGWAYQIVELEDL
jgi:hypothetical protein